MLRACDEISSAGNKNKRSRTLQEEEGSYFSEYRCFPILESKVRERNVCNRTGETDHAMKIPKVDVSKVGLDSEEPSDDSFHGE